MNSRVSEVIKKEATKATKANDEAETLWKKEQRSMRQERGEHTKSQTVTLRQSKTPISTFWIATIRKA